MRGLLWLSTACALSVSLAAAPRRQKAAEPGGTLRPLPYELEVTMMLDKDQWNQVTLYKRQEELKSASKVIADLDSFAKTESVEIGKRDAVRAHEAALVSLFAALGKMDAGARFVYLSGDVPVVFGMKDEGLAVVVSGIVSAKTYNTVNLSAAERAGDVIRLSALPALKAFAAFGNAPDVKFFGVAVVYGSRDFTGDAPSKAESLALVVPADLYRGVLSGSVTENALFQRAEAYMSGRDDSAGLQRFTLTGK
jgi:hypothetical protein